MSVVDAVTQSNPFAEAVRTRQRPGFSVEPVSIAWAAVAFRLCGARDGIVCVPRVALADFFDRLDNGHLDGSINAFLASAPQGRVLRASNQTSSPGLFDEIASPGAIVPPERVPGRGRLGGIGGGTPADARHNKNRRERGGRPSVPRRVLVVAGSAVATVAVTAAILVAASGGDDKHNVGLGPAPAVSVSSTVPRPSVTEPAASTPVSLLTPSARCADEPGLKSTNGDTPATIEFVNDTDQVLHAYWLSYDGVRTFYEDIPPHSRFSQATFVSHPWVLADTGQRCLGLDVVTGPTAQLQVPGR